MSSYTMGSGPSRLVDDLGGVAGRRRLLEVFWYLAAGLFILGVMSIRSESPRELLGAGLIALFALVPGYLWCAGKVRGLPIFPVFALSFTWTYAVQLINNHAQAVTYSPEAKFQASLTVVLFLAVATATWYLLTAGLKPEPRLSYLMLNPSRADSLLLAILAAGLIYRIGLTGGWLSIPGGLNSIVRATLLSIGAIANFALPYRWARGELSTGKARLLMVLLVGYIVANATSLLLVGALTSSFLAFAGYTLGRRKVPFRPIIMSLAVVMFLHYGKHDMRVRYWHENSIQVQPWQYPSMFVEWAGFSFKRLMEGTAGGTKEQQHFTERAGLLHLLMLSQERTANGLPYLYGTTYAVVPVLFIPRFLFPGKPPSHVGTQFINVYYGLQRPQDQGLTTIGWGLLNEAFVNFGNAGCIGLGLFLGLLFGYITRWSAGAPTLSFRFLFAILILNLAIESEFTMGVWLTVLFQYTVPLAVLALVAGYVHAMPAARVRLPTMPGRLQARAPVAP